ncbi:MAG: dihydrofolate reductase [Bacteroidales bacterium]|nr:dihydrofolate reductase [Bacteroidales bacterium]
MNISLIAAMGNRRELGYKNQLLCHLPADLKHFKELTTGHPILMGRTTWDSLPVKPLPKRRNVVLSRQTMLQNPGAEFFSSADEALQALQKEEEIFVIGGATIYQQFVNLADTIYLTQIHADFEADVFFPVLDEKKWHVAEEEFHAADEKNPFDFTFQVWKR